MHRPVERACPYRQRVVDLAHDRLAGQERLQTQEHLAHHAACRDLFRRETAGRFPEIPNYTILEQVGRGGFGLVYKAIHHDRERIEALKVRFGKALLLTSYFENEVHLIAKLRHPNIATLYDAQLSAQPQYYTMEFVEGERLNDYIRHHRVSLAERIEIIRTVALALDYAHRQGVVHRDIKPQNILVDADGQPHVVDFGIATHLGLSHAHEDDEASGETGTEGPVGTVGYISPEQLAGQRVDRRADVFALGALLFHCVTGEPARLARREDCRLKILRERRVSRADDLACIIGRCVQTDPAARYDSCRELAEDLENYLSGRAVRARQSFSPLHEARRVAAYVLRGYPLTVRAAAVALAAAVLTGVFWRLGTHAVAAPVVAAPQTMIVAFRPSTIQAMREGRIGADLPGLVPNVLGYKSWRMLHGRLLRRLAQAEPRVVVFDYSFPDCRPEYDDEFLAGIRAMPAPVVVGVGPPDKEGRPVICESIRRAVHGYGSMISTDPGFREHNYEVAYCVQRGFESPIPGLALAAFAAVRFPDARPSLHLDASRQVLEVRYRKRNPQPGSPHWYAETDRLPFQELHVLPDEPERFRYLRPGDVVARGLVPARPASEWEARTISYEDVLLADATQLRAWFHDRPVVIGQMLPGIDQHANGQGRPIFGCQVHAAALDALLAGLRPQRLPRAALLLRACAWCLLAGVTVSLLPRRRWNSLRLAGALCAVLLIGGLAVAGYGAVRVTDPLGIELVIALAGLLTAGSAAFWTKAAHERQFQLSPVSITPDDQGSTVPSTVLAETN